MNFRKFLFANELKAKDVALFLQVSEAAVSSYVREKTVPSKENLEKLLHNPYGWDVTYLSDGEEEKSTTVPSKEKIPLYDTQTIGGFNSQIANTESAGIEQWIDAGDWFPGATAALYHYGDSMIEYPAGSILVVKRVEDPRLLLYGHNYVIETSEFRVTKQLQEDGDDFLLYSTNSATYPDGRLIHSPIRIPKDSVTHFDLVIGCVIKEYSNKPISIR